MESSVSDIKFCLRKLAKKIEKVEDSDPDYANNPKWLELRNKQDELYAVLAIKEGKDVYQINR